MKHKYVQHLKIQKRTKKNLGEFIRRLVYYTNTKVDYDFFRYYNKHSSNIDIGSIWHELKFFLYGIYPEAIAMSIRISKEQLGMISDVEATDYEEAIEDKD